MFSAMAAERAKRQRKLVTSPVNVSQRADGIGKPKFSLDRPYPDGEDYEAEENDTMIRNP
jgi:hypothetical protein